VALLNVQHERNYFLRARFGIDVEVPWRTNGFLAQVAFFVLAAIGVGALYGFVDLVSSRLEGTITCFAAIVVAEYLIGARRWFFTGVEAALWVCGLFALITDLPSSGTPESWLVIGAVPAIAGARVRNPIFGAVSALYVVIYLEERLDLGVVSALLLTLIACAALLRTWQRPTTEGLWIAIALVMPVAGRLMADEVWRDVTIILYAMVGVIALALALEKRHHALFLTSMIAFGISGYDLGERIAAPEEARLAASGALLLAIAFAVSRALRGRTLGLVATPAKLTVMDEALEIGATVQLQPETSAPEVKPESGGEFGGAGASGGY
jgi:hypothetical protein